MAVITYREALNQALREELRRDDRVFVIGEEVGLYEGAYKVTQGLLKEFGPGRIVDTPIAESGFTGVGIGAAMVGLRPVVEMMTFNFALLALDQIVNTAAKMNYMSGGQYNVPIVVRGPGGPAHQLAILLEHLGRSEAVGFEDQLALEVLHLVERMPITVLAGFEVGHPPRLQRCFWGLLLRHGRPPLSGALAAPFERLC